MHEVMLTFDPQMAEAFQHLVELIRPDLHKFGEELGDMHAEELEATVCETVYDLTQSSSGMM